MACKTIGVYSTLPNRKRLHVNLFGKISTEKHILNIHMKIGASDGQLQ